MTTVFDIPAFFTGYFEKTASGADFEKEYYPWRSPRTGIPADKLKAVWDHGLDMNDLMVKLRASIKRGDETARLFQLLGKGGKYLK